VAPAVDEVVEKSTDSGGIKGLEGLKAKDEGFAADQTSKSTEVSPELLPDALAISRRPDAAIQMGLLRQAFEGLKGATQEVKSVTAGAQSSQLNSISAPSQAKAADTDRRQKSAAPKAFTRSAALRTLERVDSALREAAKSRDGKTLSFRLDPPQLGQVRVDVTLREGGLHARLVPENQQVTTLLREHAHELQSSLRRLGLNVETVSVSVGSEWSNTASDGGDVTPDGKSFQQERNKMPGEQGQVVENTFGNEIALNTQAAQVVQVGVKDHWVA
jgi:flagellar hook-length control protein FliK